MKSLQLSQPHLIIVTGIPGSGKSFFAEKLADTFGAPLVSADRIMSISAASEDEAEVLAFDALTQLVRTKHTIVVDGSAEIKRQRVELARIAKQAGYETLTVWVQTDPAAAEARSTKKPRGGEAKHSGKTFQAAMKRFVMPLQQDKENVVVISGKHTHATQTKAVLARLTSTRSNQPLTPKAPERPTAQPRRGITIR